MQQEDDENSEIALDTIKLKARANLLLALTYNRDTRINQLQDELRLRDGQIDGLQDELQSRASQIDQLKNELGQVKAQLAVILQSTSWRLTSPLRRLGRAMKRAT
jgi:hypothetical protein